MILQCTLVMEVWCVHFWFNERTQNRVSCVLIVFAFTEKTPVRYQELENWRTQDTNLVKR